MVSLLGARVSLPAELALLTTLAQGRPGPTGPGTGESLPLGWMELGRCMGSSGGWAGPTALPAAWASRDVRTRGL